MNTNTFGKFNRKSLFHEVQKLHHLKPSITFSWILLNWLIVFASIWLCYHGSMWFYFLAISIIAGRQHGFIVLMHEATHGSFVKNKKWGLLLANIFCTLPIFIDSHRFFSHHIQHHLHTNTNQDPDVVRKKGRAEWTFPMTMKQFLKAYVPFLLYRAYLQWPVEILYLSGLKPLRLAVANDQLKYTLFKFGYWALMLSVIFYFNWWTPWFLFWLVPFLFILPIFMRVRSVAEHFALPLTHELDSSRTVMAPYFETAFFSPHNINVHLPHHLFPAVPWYNLKSLHQLLMRDEKYNSTAVINDSYLLLTKKSVFKDLVKSNN